MTAEQKHILPEKMEGTVTEIVDTPLNGGLLGKRFKLDTGVTIIVNYPNGFHPPTYLEKDDRVLIGPRMGMKQKTTKFPEKQVIASGKQVVVQHGDGVVSVFHVSEENIVLN